jgi:hypothetical protein
MIQNLKRSLVTVGGTNDEPVMVVTKKKSLYQRENDTRLTSMTF